MLFSFAIYNRNLSNRSSISLLSTPLLEKMEQNISDSISEDMSTEEIERQVRIQRAKQQQ